MADGGRFQHFIAHQPKRKRAAVVCISCHEKKVKCNLQEIRGQGYGVCTNCASIGSECRFRPSNRDKRRRGSEKAGALAARRSPPSEADKDHQNLISTPPLSAEDNSRVSEYTQLESAVASGVDDGFSAFEHGDIQQSHASVSNILTAPTASPSQQRHRAVSQPQPNEGLNYRPRNDAADSYLGDTGLPEIYGLETRRDADGQVQHRKEIAESLDLPSPELQQSFEETYFEFCSTWCPVLDRDTMANEFAESPLLLNALALAGSHVQPPMIAHAGPAAYYDQVKAIFYGDKEEHLVMCLKAITLIYWWSPRAPSRVHRDSSWWWTTVAIRHAQHGGFHREPKPGIPSRANVDPGLRRRIWWTLFARERLTALCQERPCVIDPEDCDVRELSLEDFPTKDGKALIFMHWVQLCAILGDVAKYRSRSSITSASPFPEHLAKELIIWVQSLPPDLLLPIGSKITTRFNRDVHQLHLPYLAVIVVLHLSKTSQPLPDAHPPAILAASCIARILKDCLARGRIRYMMAISCWYCGIALVPLLQARRIPRLSQSAESDISILLIALKELRVMWPTANIFLQGFERLWTISESETQTHGNLRGGTADGSSTIDNVSSANGIDWTRYFSFMTVETSGLAKALLPEYQVDLFIDDIGWGFMTLNDLFDPYGSFDGSMSIMDGI